ncbi:MAG: acetyl-CoA carboxylase, biotin carboxyl carrier protein [Elusimicrobia bacterium]|nr:acetyl-CoA carboxylase, biotin carboxyl carrier protein [Elusimicrobiota bacterium]
MQEEKVEEINIKSSDIKLHIKRKNYSKPCVVSASAASVTHVEAPVQQEDNTDVVSGETITSPITGIFYRSPSPSSPMFVNEGDVVDSGKTLCIIEAMKVMNEIKATEKVKIVKILVENGQPVNSQQALFSIEKL